MFQGESQTLNSCLQAVENITRISESGESPTHSEASPRVSEKNEQDGDLSRNHISVKGDSARTLSAHAGGKSASATDICGADLGDMPSLSNMT